MSATANRKPLRMPPTLLTLSALLSSVLLPSLCFLAENCNAVSSLSTCQGQQCSFWFILILAKIAFLLLHVSPGLVSISDNLQEFQLDEIHALVVQHLLFSCRVSLEILGRNTPDGALVLPVNISRYKVCKNRYFYHFKYTFSHIQLHNYMKIQQE